MSEEQRIASRLLQAAANAANRETSEERDFNSLVRSTRRSFRRNEAVSSNRGRKRRRTFKRKVVLMKLANADFFPSNVELKFLQQRGLGEAQSSLEIERDESSVHILERIVLLFNPHIQTLLQMCGFKLAKSDRSRKIHHIGDFEDGNDLETKLGQSKIVVLPFRDFPSNLPIIEEWESAGPRPSTSRRAEEVHEEEPGTTNIRTSLPTTSRRLSNINEEFLRPTLNQITMEASTSRTFPENDMEDFELPTLPTSTPQRSFLQRSFTSRTLPEVIEDSESDDQDEQDNEVILENSVENLMYLPELPDDAELEIIEVSRRDCFYDLLNIYKDERMVGKKLDVSFTGELGIDGGGLTKELFNIFFEQSENNLLQGEDCLIPYLPLNKWNELEKFVYFGRILQHMLVLTQTVPTKLSKITLILIGNPVADIDQSIILKELGLHVNPYLRKILKKGQKNFPSLTLSEKEVIQDFFQTNKFLARPDSETFSQQLLVIGREILIEIPRRLVDKIRQGVAPQKHPHFWNNCNFSVLTDMQTVTVAKIINCIKTEDYLTNEENEVLHYFKMYINCLDTEKLGKLVFMITGSFLMPDYIDVKFNDSVGLSQRPIFNTCTNSLTLPKTYVSYTELKNDLNICLASDEAKAYTTY